MDSTSNPKRKTIEGEGVCHNPNLGLTTKARASKVAGHEGGLGITSHAPGSAKSAKSVRE
jgi:hypothetical protein